MDFNLFLIFLAASAAAGATGMLFKPGAWYEGLAKPDWRPPTWVFPIAWTTIYVLSSLAAARIAGLPGSGYAMAFWAMQIGFNTLWTPTFFGARRMGLAVGVMAALCVAVLGMLITFWRLDFWAGTMLVPYFAWLCLAAPLNVWVWRNNSGGAAAV